MTLKEILEIIVTTLMLNGVTPLTLNEALKIKEVYFPYADMQWLFKKRLNESA